MYIYVQKNEKREKKGKEKKQEELTFTDNFINGDKEIPIHIAVFMFGRMWNWGIYPTG